MKILNLFTALVLLTMISCSKENLNEPFTEKLSPLKAIVKLESSNMLAFKNVEELEKTIIQLIKSDEDEQEAWAASHNFISQKMAYYRALDELEEIQNLTDYSKYVNEYKKFKSKYSSYFLFNENKEDNDLSPYIPSNRAGYWMVCNINGEVMVGDSVFCFNELKSIEETDYYKYLHAPATKTVEEKLNFLYIREGKRKMWAKAVRDKHMVCIKYSAHKKGIFGGWNKYRTKYYTAYISHDPATWTGYDTFKVKLEENKPNFLESKELHSGAEVLFGFTRYDVSSGRVLCEGVAKLRIKSRGTKGTSGILSIRK